jgi:hypothetical protein
VAVPEVSVASTGEMTAAAVTAAMKSVAAAMPDAVTAPAVTAAAVAAATVTSAFGLCGYIGRRHHQAGRSGGGQTIGSRDEAKGQKLAQILAKASLFSCTIHFRTPFCLFKVPIDPWQSHNPTFVPCGTPPAANAVIGERLAMPGYAAFVLHLFLCGLDRLLA